MPLVYQSPSAVICLLVKQFSCCIQLAYSMYMYTDIDSIPIVSPHGLSVVVALTLSFHDANSDALASFGVDTMLEARILGYFSS